MKTLSQFSQRWMWFIPLADNKFEVACAVEATRTCVTLAECAGVLPRLFSDAYLMGGEL